MSKAVRFERYGDVDVLQVVEVPRPVPGRCRWSCASGPPG